MNRAARTTEQTQRGSRSFHPREFRFYNHAFTGATPQVCEPTLDRPDSSTNIIGTFTSFCIESAVLVVCFGLAALVLVFGCVHTVDFDKERRSSGAISSSGALYASVVGTGTVDISKTIEEVDSEEVALEAFFKARDLLAKGDSCDRAPEARGNYAQARKLFEKSMRFYIPDLQAMTFGREPVHPSANWHFLRSLHDYWGKASVLSGRSTEVDKIEENAKDAWALAVIQEVTRGMSIDERRRLTASSFHTVKNGLVAQVKQSERFTLLDESVFARIKAEVAHGLPAAKKNHNEVVGDGAGGTNISRLYEQKMDRIRRASEKSEIQKMARIQSANHMSGYCFFMGDPANGSVCSVRVQN